MSTNTQTESKGIVRNPTIGENPRTAIRDAVLADVSTNVDGEDVIDGLLWLVEDDTRTATITGPGRMVGFHEFNAVAL